MHQLYANQELEPLKTLRMSFAALQWFSTLGILCVPAREDGGCKAGGMKGREVRKERT